MTMEALGRVFDVAHCFTPVDLNTANGATGARIHLKNYAGVTFILYKGAGTAGEDPDIDIQQHTAATGGTSADLDNTGVSGTRGITKFFRKEETTLDGDEAWSKVTQTEASEVDLGDASAEVEGLYAVEVLASQLADGYEWVSMNVAVTAAAAQLGAGLAILHDLAVQRSPENLAQPNA